MSRDCSIRITKCVDRHVIDVQSYRNRIIEKRNTKCKRYKSSVKMVIEIFKKIKNYYFFLHFFKLHIFLLLQTK